MHNSTRRTLRIAVLECDTPIGHTREKYGTYGNLFKELLTNGVKEVVEHDPRDSEGQIDLDIEKYDVVNAEVYPSLDRGRDQEQTDTHASNGEVNGNRHANGVLEKTENHQRPLDAILITGSRFNAFDHDPWIEKLVEFTRGVLHDNRTQRKIRVIGVCFGHQIVARALGVKVARSDIGWEVAVTSVDLTGLGKKLFGVDELQIHQMHRDIVTVYPSSVEKLGHSNRCEVQGMYEKGRLIAVQGHPEFNGDIVTELVETRHQQGIFDQAMYEDAMARVRERHDGVAVGAAFIRFLLED